MDAEDIDEEKYILFNYNCTTFKSRFQRNEYHFGSEENTTFYVYVYDFRSPIQITVLENSSLNDICLNRNDTNFRSTISGLLQSTSKIGVATVFHHLFCLLYIPAHDGRNFVENQAEVRHVSKVKTFSRPIPSHFCLLTLNNMCSHVLFFSFRRQRLFVEMEQMASRPFSHVLVELQVPPNFPRRAPVPNNRCTSGQYLSNFYPYFIVMC